MVGAGRILSYMRKYKSRKNSSGTESHLVDVPFTTNNIRQRTEDEGGAERFQHTSGEKL